MGLDMSHDAWSAPYSVFSRFRNDLAKIAGYWVMPVTYNDGMTWDTVMIDWGHLPEGSIQGNWGGVVPDDALLYLVAHSDCDGHLKPKACTRVADRLEELLPEIRKLRSEGGHVGLWEKKTLQLIKGLRAAAAEGKRLKFF